MIRALDSCARENNREKLIGMIGKTATLFALTQSALFSMVALLLNYLSLLYIKKQYLSKF